mmetsp:Transcript_47142/g.148242  ORF Transcript_47142/g.148242 Transcript_47142/m.148242 type:complete len:275 (+) Transcript_47142:418-1242(+)
MTTPAARSTSSLPAASRTQTSRRPPPPCRHRLDRHPQPAPTPPQVEAPALVRYPIGTHHAAMTQPFEGRTEILTWWGLMQATSATESAQHVALCPRLLVPRQREASWIDGPRRGWAISKDGLETRIERWAPHAKKALVFRRPIKEIYLLRGSLSAAQRVEGATAGEALGLLAEGDWICFAHEVSQVDAAAGPDGATLLVKELLPYDSWRRHVLQDVRQSWHSWSGATGRASGRGHMPAASLVEASKSSQRNHLRFSRSRSTSTVEEGGSVAPGQ